MSNDNNNNENNNDNINIDDKITQLKKLVEKYDKMDNIEKIKHTDNYNNIIQEKESCINLVNKYKNAVDNIDKNKNNITEEIVTDDKVFMLLEQFNEIKKQINDSTLNLNELIDLYIKLNNVKTQLDLYFGNKKLQIVKL